MKCFDVNGSATIDFDEFSEVLADHGAPQAELLENSTTVNH